MNSGLASQPCSTDWQRGHAGPLSGHGGTAPLGPARALVGQEGSGRAGSGPCRAVYPGADGALAPARSERRDGRSAGPTARCVAAGAGLPATCARCLRRDGAEWDGEAPEEMWQLGGEEGAGEGDGGVSETQACSSTRHQEHEDPVPTSQTGTEAQGHRLQHPPAG